MAILVYAEHDNKELKKATLNTVTAASKIGGDIVVLDNANTTTSSSGHDRIPKNI